jgi:hypothetical protein
MKQSVDKKEQEEIALSAAKEPRASPHLTAAEKNLSFICLKRKA